MKKYVVSENENGQTLERYVRKVLNVASLSFIYKLFRKKDVRVNNHWQKEKYIVYAGDEITIYITDSQYEEFSHRLDVKANDDIKDWIVYEDSNILIINKPRGILVQPDDSNQKALDQMVIEYLISTNEYDPNKELSFKPGPAHRIDRNTSGLVIFGKNYESLLYLFNLLKERELIGKHYTALVVGNLDEDGFVDAPLKKDETKNMVVVSSTKDGGKPSKTIYKVLERYDGFTLLDLTLVTGRTHQIRVHMAYINHPLVGDSKYGDFGMNGIFQHRFNFKNQFLHAGEIHFGKLEYPLGYLSSMSFKAELPADYQEILNVLREGNNEGEDEYEFNRI